MKKASVNLAVIFLLCMPLLCSCSIITGEDLKDLESQNAITKKEVLARISKKTRFPRSFLGRFFGRTNDQRALIRLLALLKSEGEPRGVKLGVLKTLGRMAERTEVPVSPLFDQLKSKNDLKMKAQLIATLGKTKNPEVVPVLIKDMQKDENIYVRIWALGEIGMSSATIPLNELLQSKDVYVRYNARRALRKIAHNEKNEDRPLSSFTDPQEEKGSLSGFGRMISEKYQRIMVAVFNKIDGK